MLLKTVEVIQSLSGSKTKTRLESELSAKEKSSRTSFFYFVAKDAANKTVHRNAKSEICNRLGSTTFGSHSANGSFVPFVYKEYLSEYHELDEFILPGFTITINKLSVAKLEKQFGYASSSNPVLIAKPAGAAKGRGIVVSDDYEELIDLIKTEYVKSKKRYNSWRIEEYLQDQLLFDDRKMHLRAFLLVIYNFKTKELFTCPYDDYMIVQAAEPYTESDWNNKKIHDTHYNSTDQTLGTAKQELLDDHELGDVIDENCQRMLETVEEIMGSATVSRHPNLPEKLGTHIAFEILSLDIGIDNDGSAHLYEINDRTSVPASFEAIGTDLLTFVWKEVLDEYDIAKRKSKSKNKKNKN